jgi:hypothetical protein
MTLKKREVATRQRLAQCPWNRSPCESQRSSSRLLVHAQSNIAVQRGGRFGPVGNRFTLQKQAAKRL